MLISLADKFGGVLTGLRNFLRLYRKFYKKYVTQHVTTWVIFSKRSVNLRELEDGGERIEISYRKGRVNFASLDIYQRSHFRRYEFAQSVIISDGITGDLACGTGYGSVMLAERSRKVIAVDINNKVIDRIRVRYKSLDNIDFICADLLDLNYQSLFDNIVSFETIEHLKADDIVTLLNIFSNALKPAGLLLFSTPYMQENSLETRKMGFHLTFQINENTIEQWLSESGFSLVFFKYQDYPPHSIQENQETKDFVICCARKSSS